MRKQRFPGVSIVVATRNNSETLKKTIEGLLGLDYPGKYEIIVVDDGSTDNTGNVLEGFRRRVKAIRIEHTGVCAARNAGIRESNGSIIVNMDHDCIPEMDWLKNLVKGFDSERVGIVSSYGYYGGTSTAFRKELLEKVGGYDEEYYYYREDTDLSFKIMDLGYEFRLVKAGYIHDHEMVKPKGVSGAMRYVIQRWNYHMNDVLLYKKHRKLARDFLDVRAGFIVNPLADFRAATGLWDGRYELSSPRGIVFVKNKSPLHGAGIFLIGIAYMVGVKVFRLKGSLKFRELLI